MPKYKLFPVESTSFSKELYTIVAQEDFVAMDGTFIPCGTQGGFVASKNAIPNTHSDKSWVFAANGFVCGNATIVNSVVRFGFVSGNAKVTNSIIDKKSAIMEDATIEDSTIYDSVVGCGSKVMNCLLKKGNCINLYEKSCMIGVYLENASISGNYIINEGRFVDVALHNSDKIKTYNKAKLHSVTDIGQIKLPYREKHGTTMFVKRNREASAELKAAKLNGELPPDYDINK